MMKREGVQVRVSSVVSSNSKFRYIMYMCIEIVLKLILYMLRGGIMHFSLKNRKVSFT